jgi:hypothetical protein
MNFYTGSLFLLFFTFAFIAVDEYIAKPLRRRRMLEKAKTDPEVRRALEIADRVEREHGGRQ